MPDDADLVNEGREDEAKPFGEEACCKEDSGRGGKRCWAETPLGVPFFVGLATGMVCGGRGAT